MKVACRDWKLASAMLLMKATATVLQCTAVRGTIAHMNSARSSVAKKFVPAKPQESPDDERLRRFVASAQGVLHCHERHWQRCRQPALTHGDRFMCMPEGAQDMMGLTLHSGN